MGARRGHRAVLAVVSPSTEEVVGEVPVAEPADIDNAVAAAAPGVRRGPVAPHVAGRASRRAAPRRRPRSRKREPRDRRRHRRRDGLRDQPGAPGPDRHGRARSSTTTPTCSAPTTSSARSTAGDRRGLVVNEPVGVVAAIVPWNAPVTLAAWKAGAGAGRRLHRRPQAATRGAAEQLRRWPRSSRRSGLPPGVVNVVPGGREVGEHLVTHPDIDKVAFTGSTAAGKRIMSAVRRPGEAGLARARRQVGRHRARRRRPRRRRSPRIVGGVMHLSGQVCGAHTRVLVPRVALRRGRRAGGCRRRARSRRRPARPGDGRRAARRRAAARPRRGLHRARRRATAPGSSAAGADPPTCRRAGTSRRRSSPTSTTACGWPARRSSGRSLCFIPYDDEDDAVAHRQRLAATGCPAACGRRRRAGLSPSPGGCAPAASRSTARTRRSRSCRSAASRSPASAASSAPEGLASFLEPRSIGAAGDAAWTPPRITTSRHDGRCNRAVR